jgi:hypothetical protein
MQLEPDREEDKNFDAIVPLSLLGVSAFMLPAQADPQEACVMATAGAVVCGKPIAKPNSHGKSPTVRPLPSGNDDNIKTYVLYNNIYGLQTTGLKITGNRKHTCNVLLPRGPGIGGSFFYPSEASLWQELRCPELYCNLNDVNSRISLRSQWAKPNP